MKQHVSFPMSLYTRIAIIDQQHKDLIDAVNKLYDAINEGKGVEEAKKALAFLSQYVIFHFAGEEKLWSDNRYPKFEEHKAAHDAFTKTVKELHDMLVTEGATDAFADKVEAEVTNWLINHIQGLDRDAADWLNTKSGWQMDNML